MGVTSTDIKRQELAELKKCITKHFGDREIWFFPDKSDSISGYYGTGPVMFVAERPSLGKGTSKKNTDGPGGFYSLLVEYGFKDAHITDLVKESMKTGRISDDQIEENWPFIQREMEIVQPSFVVAIGRKVQGELKRRMGPEIPVEYMLHYSYRYCSPKEREERLRADLAKIRTKVAALTGA